MQRPRIYVFFDIKMLFKKYMSARVDLTEYIYKDSNINSNEHYLLEAELPQSPESHCKIMTQMPHVPYRYPACNIKEI